MAIPLVDLKAQYKSIKDEIDAALRSCVEKTQFIGGELLEKFEAEFAKFCRKKYCIGVSSGTSALYVALRLSGIKPGDEVITVPNTFIATAEVVSQLGAEVKFVDIREDTLLMSPEKLKAAITKKTKAIIPVHLFGQMCDMAPIMEIAREHALAVIEDCAQSHGAEQDGLRNPVGDFGCFSFYPGKNLGAYGDAGAIVTDSPEFAEKARRYINHGRAKGEKYSHASIGSNFRMDTLQAAILGVKLKYLERWTEQRRKNAALYTSLLKGMDGINGSCTIKTPFESQGYRHVYHLYPILAEKRDQLKAFLYEKGISTEIHYPIPLHLQPAYASLNIPEGSFPVAEKAAKQLLSLPMYPELNEEQIGYIAEQVKSFLS